MYIFIYLNKGDLFDEGQWCNEFQFFEYTSRFSHLFETPNTTKLYVVPGNHDVGFHYALSRYTLDRFENIFNVSSVELLNLKDNLFILINSMAMENDGCFFCSEAEKKIKNLASMYLSNNYKISK